MAKKKKVDINKEEEIEEVVETEEKDEIVEEISNNEDEEYEELSVEERVLNIEKKVNLIFIFVLIGLALSLITLIVTMNGTNTNASKDANSSEKSSSSEDATYDTSAFKEITAQDIATESKRETIVVMIGRQGCGYCAIYAPIIQKVAEAHNITVRYIDYTKMVDIAASTIIDTEAFNIIKDMDAVDEFEGAGETALRGTPATLIIKNSKILYYIKGAAQESTVEAAFKSAGIK